MSGSFGAEDLPVSGEPWVLFDGPDYAVVYKPPGMFSAPQKRDAGGKTLLGWYADRFPAVLEIRGRQAWEGGILHRLDYETSGLVLFAKNQTAMETLSARQAAGCFVKDYQALTAKERSPTRLPGFPPPPEAADSPEPRSIESAFRPYGPGRKVVRPVAWAAA
ncbi:MAG: RNA pseudouridine synthase, partial [Spirochaetaceae bacterium]|nr:RNA pseudouridine synthase [Spirochaetaceae bacterium]